MSRDGEPGLLAERAKVSFLCSEWRSWIKGNEEWQMREIRSPFRLRGTSTRVQGGRME